MQTATEPRNETARLADQLERAFRGGSWHGPSVLQALEGVTPLREVRLRERASRRPLTDAHSIWEIAVHIGTWMEVTRQRVLGEEASTPADERDWAAIEDQSEQAWRETLAALEEGQRSLQAVVRELGDARLDDPVPGSDPTVRGLLLGVLQHNVYHAGQISVLKKAAPAAELSA